MPEQVDAQPQQESVDPAIQQISDFISQAIGQGQNAAEVVMSLVEQQVDQQTIGQALMMNGFEEDDIMALFQQMSQGQQLEEQGGGEPDIANLDKSPEELTGDERIHADDMSAEETDEPGMSLGKSGIEIKPENEGKFTRWAEARGMSVQEAARKVMANTDEYPPAVVKMANFAKNAAGWKHEYGGSIMAQEGIETVATPKVDFNTIDVLQGMDPDKGSITNFINYNGQIYQLPGNDKDFVRINFKNALDKGKITPLANVPPSVISYFNPPKKAFGGQSYAPGGETQNRISRVNNVSSNPEMHWQRAPLYMNPIAFETSNKDFSLGKAAAVLYGGYKDFLSGKENEQGVKEGFFRDTSKKAALRDATKGDYYNYEITQDPKDPNRYVADNLDLFNASKNKGDLRTVDQYGKDILENSRFNYNTDTHDYDFITSSRPIDERIYDSAGQKNAIAGKNYNYLSRMDPDTLAMIKGGKDDPTGVRMGIDEYGSGKSYLPGADNPYEYNTYMGINKVGQSSMIPVGTNGQPTAAMFDTPAIPGIPSSMRQQTDYKTDTQAVQDSQLQKRFPGLGPTPEQQRQSMFGEQSISDALRNLRFRYGGDLDKAQVGPPNWLAGMVNQNDYFNPTQQQGMNDFFSNMGQTNYMQDTQAVADAQLQNQFPGLGTTPQQQQMQGMFAPQQGTPTLIDPNASTAASRKLYDDQQALGAAGQQTISLTDAELANEPGFGQPKVKRTNKLEGGLNRFLDSRAVQGVGKASNFLVQASGVVNDWFRDKSVNAAREANHNKLGADYQYATAEDPFNKRGLWDTNTGTAGSEGDRTTGLYMNSKYGGENKTMEVDTNLLAKLIAAGADIEIL